MKVPLWTSMYSAWCARSGDVISLPITMTDSIREATGEFTIPMEAETLWELLWPTLSTQANCEMLLDTQVRIISNVTL
jgi:hypothetical protein